MKCAAFQCLQKALIYQPNDCCLTTDTNIQLIIALRTLQSPSDISVCAYWLRALVEAHVCLAAREELKSITLLNETLEITSKLFKRKSKELCETIYASSTRLIQCCIQQNSTASVSFLSCLHAALDLEFPDSWKWILLTMGNLFQEAQSLILGDTFNCVLKELAEFRDKDKKCFCSKEIEEVFFLIFLQEVILNFLVF